MVSLFYIHMYHLQFLNNQYEDDAVISHANHSGKNKEYLKERERHPAYTYTSHLVDTSALYIHK